MTYIIFHRLSFNIIFSAIVEKRLFKLLEGRYLLSAGIWICVS